MLFLYTEKFVLLSLRKFACERNTKINPQTKISGREKLTSDEATMCHIELSVFVLNDPSFLFKCVENKSI